MRCALSFLNCRVAQPPRQVDLMALATCSDALPKKDVARRADHVKYGESRSPGAGDTARGEDVGMGADWGVKNG